MGNLKDLTGQKFGRLTVVKRVENIRDKSGRLRVRYLCKCECGKEKVVYGENLSGRKTFSCGCLRNEKLAKLSTTHGDTNSRLYNVWSAIKRRCYNPRCPEYRLYGGRGIKMCDDWKNDYSSFKSWAESTGYNPNALRGECTIDRMDCDGNYEPSNCKWSTAKEQMNNVRYNHHLTFKGETHTIAEWSEICDISYACLINRINKFNYDVETALTKPPRKTKTKKA